MLLLLEDCGAWRCEVDGELLDGMVVLERHECRIYSRRPPGCQGQYNSKRTFKFAGVGLYAEDDVNRAELLTRVESC